MYVISADGTQLSLRTRLVAVRVLESAPERAAAIRPDIGRSGIGNLAGWQLSDRTGHDYHESSPVTLYDAKRHVQIRSLDEGVTSLRLARRSLQTTRQWRWRPVWAAMLRPIPRSICGTWKRRRIRRIAGPPRPAERIGKRLISIVWPARTMENRWPLSAIASCSCGGGHRQTAAVDRCSSAGQFGTRISCPMRQRDCVFARRSDIARRAPMG